MKTTLKQQKDLVEEIQKLSLIHAIKRLREWILENGYEGSQDCRHYAVVRTTGKCMNCSTVVAEPILTGSDEMLEALRARLRGD